jgi:hypothetical protein
MTYGNKIKITLLADQPWEAEFMAMVGKNLLILNPEVSLSLCFTDYYTFLLRSDFLRGLRAGFPGDIVTQQEIFASWQVATENPRVDFEYLKDWNQKYCSVRTLDEIELTNQWVHGAERSQWYLPISELWKKRILEDTLKWCMSYKNDFAPTIYVAINNSTLPISIFNTLAASESIPFLSFIPSRIGHRKLLRKDFGYGLSNELYTEILEKYSGNSQTSKASQYLNELTVSKDGSYDSTTNLLTREFRLKSRSKFKSLRKDLRLLAGRIYGRMFIQPKEKSITVRRISQDFLKMSLIEFRGIINFNLRLFGIKLFGSTQVPTQRYFFWALHLRPEGSVLAAGDGRDEIEELLKCASLLPEGYFIAVKENPDMVGVRQPGFYRNLKKNRRLILIDPYVPASLLIENSLGVIGISGTVLLESAFLNKPSCALGHPEFDRFLCAHGWNSAEVFINRCIRGDYEEPNKKVLPYLAYVLNNSSESDIAFGGDLTSLEAEEMSYRFAHQVLEMIQ